MGATDELGSAVDSSGDSLAGIPVLDVSRWRDRRIEALRAHRTQRESIDRCFFAQPDPHRILDSEIWRQGWGPALPRRPVTDVMAGLEATPRVADADGSTAPPVL
jgi:hypothetical protein